MDKIKLNLNKQILQRLFTSASIRRWNDKACPLDFVELDKQAHKIIIAYIFAKIEEDSGKVIDYIALIEKFFFEFFERVVLTDIKPPIFHRLKETHSKELAQFVISQLKDELKDYAFFSKMEDFLTHNDESLESRILKAAHFCASKWEFDIIYNFNPKLYDMENIKSTIDGQNEQFYDILGMQHIRLYSNLQECIGIFAELRFQKRWTQTPRIPQTSVLGHTLIVAMCAYFLSMDFNLPSSMCKEHFFCGLFHDLPEVLTRDIISPIKKSVEGLDSYLKEIEEEEMQSKILSKLPDFIAKDIAYWTKNEFSNRFVENGEVIICDSAETLLDNSMKERAICGDLLKFCDKLSAFLEAKISILHGVSSKELEDGVDSIYDDLCKRYIRGVGLASVADGFIFGQKNRC